MSEETQGKVILKASDEGEVVIVADIPVRSHFAGGLAIFIDLENRLSRGLVA